MSLENKSLAELEKARFGPAHANSAQSESFHDGKAELEDVEGWIKLRRKEAKPSSRVDDETAS